MRQRTRLDRRGGDSVLGCEVGLLSAESICCCKCKYFTERWQIRQSARAPKSTVCSLFPAAPWKNRSSVARCPHPPSRNSSTTRRFPRRGKRGERYRPSSENKRGGLKIPPFASHLAGYSTGILLTRMVEMRERRIFSTLNWKSASVNTRPGLGTSSKVSKSQPAMVS